MLSFVLVVKPSPACSGAKPLHSNGAKSGDTKGWVLVQNLRRGRRGLTDKTFFFERRFFFVC